jgi:hypothetical protein
MAQKHEFKIMGKYVFSTSQYSWYILLQWWTFNGFLTILGFFLTLNR